MLSTDLAHLYQVAARALVQAVKRNLDRFPDDFMFQLSSDELRDLRSQIVTSSWGGLQSERRPGEARLNDFHKESTNLRAQHRGCLEYLSGLQTLHDHLPIPLNRSSRANRTPLL